ncbi:uncharacterized protein ACA1_091930 [Acanthamoeba castellanii str. Neff]|uniref:DUF7275 domain-containing protein n=1 Tax=Acanthamoeba castellanii (strain ATCC 30010 / Neff) TaxID=1257118 RepID=L8GIV9_ACACF|nr:uncharacterized protein ACA1_091930 [Acanthamoeba castellanii str. Neff]ELR12683.1 hypothetical protein ACA1_091930 [Acanthamoeba castellanii str. Neff]
MGNDAGGREHEEQPSKKEKRHEAKHGNKKKRKRAGACLVAEGYDEVLTFLGTLINEFKPTHVKFPSAILIGSRAAYYWDPDTMRTPDDWNLVILPWALENWLAINHITMTKPESKLKLYEYVLPNPRLPEAALPKRPPGQPHTLAKTWRVDCVIDQQVLHFDLCAKYLYDRAVQMQPSSNCLLFDLVANFLISHKERITAVKPFPGGGRAMVAPLELLEAIKRSHIHWPGDSWHKHVHDLHALRKKLEQKAGAKFDESQRSEETLEFLQRRYRETEERMGVPGMHLDFDTSTSRSGREFSHQHQAYHRVVARGELPVYEELQRNHVLSMDVFNNLRHESKLKLIREEVMTLALERRLAPNDTSAAESAFADALEMFCTVLTRGKLRDFALDHYPELERAKSDFVALCEEEASRKPGFVDGDAGDMPPTMADAHQSLQNAVATCPVLNLPDHAPPEVLGAPVL